MKPEKALWGVQSSRGVKVETEKTMTATDVTGFYAFFSAFFSAQKSGKFLHIWGDFLTKLLRNLEKREKTHRRKLQKSSGDGALKRFLSLVVVERVLTKERPEFRAQNFFLEDQPEFIFT